MKKLFLLLSMSLFLAPALMAGVKPFCPFRASYHCGVLTLTPTEAKYTRALDAPCPIFRASNHCSGGHF